MPHIFCVRNVFFKLAFVFGPFVLMFPDGIETFEKVLNFEFSL